MALLDWIESHKWRSVEQKEGFLAMVKDLRDGKPGRQIDLPYDHMEVFAWFIQKDHESNQWWSDRFEDFAKKVDDQFVNMILENRELRRELDELKRAHGRPG